MSSSVSQVAVSHAARRASTLPRIDYADAFAVRPGPGTDVAAEDWARRILEGAPAAVRRSLRTGWTSLGLRIGPEGAPGHVLGWEVERSEPGLILLNAPGRVGLAGQVLLRIEPGIGHFSTFVRLGNPVARTAWAPIAPGHRRVVTQLLSAA